MINIKFRILKKFLSFLIIISLILSIFIYPTFATESKSLLTQDHIHSILETDLSIYDGERMPFVPADNDGDMHDDDLNYPTMDFQNYSSDSMEPYEQEQSNAHDIINPLRKIDMWNDQTYETNRFIIKYKEDISFNTIRNSFRRFGSVDLIESNRRIDNESLVNIIPNQEQILLSQNDILPAIF